MRIQYHLEAELLTTDWDSESLHYRSILEYLTFYIKNKITPKQSKMRSLESVSWKK